MTKPMSWRWKIQFALAVLLDLICAPFIREGR